MNSALRLILAGGVVGFLSKQTNRAQSFFGSITGMVEDPGRVAVPGADVTVTNHVTTLTRRVTANSVGVFSSPNLDIDPYSVKISARGVSSCDRQNLALMANQIINVEASLKLGSSSELVQVREASPIISTEANDISTSMRGEALPLIGRHAADCGIYTCSMLATGTSTSSSSSYPAFEGTRSTAGVMATMDGISVTAYSQGRARLRLHGGGAGDQG
jgi:hypothetical protein